MYKDIKLWLDEAERLHAPMWVCSTVRQLWLEAHGHFGPESDFTNIVKLVEQWADVQVKLPSC